MRREKDLGLDSEIDALMRDNPDLTPQEAEAKMLENIKERIKVNRMKLVDMVNGQKENPEEKKEELNDDDRKDVAKLMNDQFRELDKKDAAK